MLHSLTINVLLVISWVSTVNACSIKDIGACFSRISSLEGDVSRITGDLSAMTSHRNLLQSYIDDIKNTVATNVKNVLDADGGPFDTIRDVIGTPPAPFDSIYDVIEDIPDMVIDFTKLFDIFTTPPLSISSVNGDVQSLSGTLSSCLASLNGIFDLKSPLNGLLNVNFPSIVELPDPEDVVYDSLAQAMLPFKSQIEMACTKGVPILTEFATKIKEMDLDVLEFPSDIPPSRRRRLTNILDKHWCQAIEHDADFVGKCIKPDTTYCQHVDASKGEFCELEEVEYPIDDPYNVLYQLFSNLNVMILDIYDSSNGLFYLTLDTTRFILDMIKVVVDHIADAVIDCSSDAQSSCTFAIIGESIKGIAEGGMKFIEFILKITEYHDGEIEYTKLSAIYKDRVTIVHNQNALKSILDTEFDQVNNNIITQTRNMTVQFSELTNFIDQQFVDLSTMLTTEFNDMTYLINTRFDNLQELNINLFNLQNQWLNIKLNDVFDQLNSLEKLIKTPSGQRPGWNRQDLNDLFIEPIDIDIPQWNDQVDLSAQSEPELIDLNAVHHSTDQIASKYLINLTQFEKLFIAAGIIFLGIIAVTSLLNLCKSNNKQYRTVSMMSDESLD